LNAPILSRKRNRASIDHPLLLAFSGKGKAGKSTSADYVNNKHGGVKFAFAYALKAEIYELLALKGLDLKEFLEYAGDGVDISAAPKPNLNNPKRADKIAWVNRHKDVLGDLMQVYGDYKRSADPHYFINKTLKQIERAVEAGEYVVCVDDGRFLNEAKALEEIGFNIVRVQASDEVRVARGEARNPTHPSETDLDSFYHSFVIHNNLEIHDLYRQIDTVVESVLNHEQ
jgi:hypothetical protein